MKAVSTLFPSLEVHLLAEIGNKLAEKHGEHAFLTRNELPPEKTWIQTLTESYRAGLIADLGGPVMITTAEEMLIDSTIRAKVIELLLADFFIDAIARKNAKKINQSLTRLATYMNTGRLNLLALGLRRRANEKSLNDALNEVTGHRKAEKQEGDKDHVRDGLRFGKSRSGQDSENSGGDPGDSRQALEEGGGGRPRENPGPAEKV